MLTLDIEFDFIFFLINFILSFLVYIFLRIKIIKEKQIYFLLGSFFSTTMTSLGVIEFNIGDQFVDNLSSTNLFKIEYFRQFWLNHWSIRIFWALPTLIIQNIFNLSLEESFTIYMHLVFIYIYYELMEYTDKLVDNYNLNTTRLFDLLNFGLILSLLIVINGRQVITILGIIKLVQFSLREDYDYNQFPKILVFVSMTFMSTTSLLSGLSIFGVFLIYKFKNTDIRRPETNRIFGIALIFSIIVLGFLIYTMFILSLKVYEYWSVIPNFPLNIFTHGIGEVIFSNFIVAIMYFYSLTIPLLIIKKKQHHITFNLHLLSIISLLYVGLLILSIAYAAIVPIGIGFWMIIHMNIERVMVIMKNIRENLIILPIPFVLLVFLFLAMRDTLISM